MNINKQYLAPYIRKLQTLTLITEIVYKICIDSVFVGGRGYDDEKTFLSQIIFYFISSPIFMVSNGLPVKNVLHSVELTIQGCQKLDTN